MAKKTIAPTYMELNKLLGSAGLNFFLRVAEGEKKNKRLHSRLAFAPLVPSCLRNLEQIVSIL